MATTPDKMPAQSDASEEGLETATLKLPPETLKFLREAASKRGVSVGDMVRIAIGTQKYLSEAIEKGAKVQVKEKTKTLDLSV